MGEGRKSQCLSVRKTVQGREEGDGRIDVGWATNTCPIMVYVKLHHRSSVTIALNFAGIVFDCSEQNAKVKDSEVFRVDPEPSRR